MTTVSWPAPAKLNLMLRITGRRPDGYHELQTVFRFVDLCDELHFEVTRSPEITRVSDLAGVAPAQDLVVRAAQALQAYAGVPSGVRIRVDKRLPMGGGLGGGSSDAATTLLALNTLWELSLSDDELATLGLALGADVPVFVHGRAAWAEGVGERLTPLSLPPAWYVIACPACEVSTAAVFQDPELTRNSSRITIGDFLAGDARNDCEAVVRRRHPLIDASLQRLEQLGPAQLTGTGGCMFVPFDSAAEAREAQAALPDELPSWVAKGLDRSPALVRRDAGS